MTSLTPIAQILLPHGAAPPQLTRRQKAAIVVQFLMNEGADVPLSELPDALQAGLTQQLGEMRYVRRDTLLLVVREFVEELESIGLAFPDGIAGALTAMDGKISVATAQRLRKEAGVRLYGNPWERISALETEKILEIAQRESTEVAAVLMSKIDVARAAEILGKLPGDRARRITYAVSLTGSVTPEAVDRIGLSLASQLDAEPARAFDTPPEDRIGEILNFSPSDTREDLLNGLTEDDSAFADQVRKAIFTFAHIPERVLDRDLPRILRDVEQPVLVTALAFAAQGDLANVSEFVLNNISKRMAEGLREEIAEAGEIKSKAGEEAMTQVVGAVRSLATAGEITLVTSDADDE